MFFKEFKSVSKNNRWRRRRVSRDNWGINQLLLDYLLWRLVTYLLLLLLLSRLLLLSDLNLRLLWMLIIVINNIEFSILNHRIVLSCWWIIQYNTGSCWVEWDNIIHLRRWCRFWKFNPGINFDFINIDWLSSQSSLSHNLATIIWIHPSWRIYCLSVLIDSRWRLISFFKVILKMWRRIKLIVDINNLLVDAIEGLRIILCLELRLRLLIECCLHWFWRHWTLTVITNLLDCSFFFSSTRF